MTGRRATRSAGSRRPTPAGPRPVQTTAAIAIAAALGVVAASGPSPTALIALVIAAILVPIREAWLDERRPGRRAFLAILTGVLTLVPIPAAVRIVALVAPALL